MRKRHLNRVSASVLWLVAGLSVLLVSCGDDSTATQSVLQAAAIESGDTCHLCGMVISEYPGPKGEVGLKGDREVRKFCSTRDLFGFYLQPENQHRATIIYVHDMSKSPWASPIDDHFINAKNAWYVYGSGVAAAMGEALASFGDEAGALAFVAEFGGEVYRFDDITLELIGSPKAMHSMTMHKTETTGDMPMHTTEGEHSAMTQMSH